MNRLKKVFYLTPLVTPNESVWYLRTPLGHKVLEKIYATECSIAYMYAGVCDEVVMDLIGCSRMVSEVGQLLT